MTKEFTLAEILITLGIIGVVSALTIPTLLANKAKQETVGKFEKAYTMLTQVVKFSEQDNRSNQYWDWGFGGTLTPRQSFDTYWAPYLKVVKYCSTASECGYTTPIMGLSGGNSWNTVDAPTRTTVMLADGTTLVVRASGGSPLTLAKDLFIDINGALGPNIAGKDVFWFAVDTNKGLMPMGYDKSVTTITNDCSKTGTGVDCSAKIVQDSWQIKDDYPW